MDGTSLCLCSHQRRSHAGGIGHCVICKSFGIECNEYRHSHEAMESEKRIWDRLDNALDAIVIE